MESCHGMQCVEADADCRIMVDNTGDYCYGDVPCDRGLCEADGNCGNQVDPCIAQVGTNQCLNADCQTDTDPTASVPWKCVTTYEADLSACGVDGNACYGGTTGSYCYRTPDTAACIPGPGRPCVGTDLSDVQVCTPNYAVPGTTTCPDLDPQVTPLDVACGLSAHQNAPSPFRTREFYSYGGSCTGSFPGMEGAYRLSGLSAGQNVTLATDQTSGPLSILLLGNFADPSTCLQQGSDVLSFTATGATADFIVEATPGYPPASFRLTITCN